MLKHPDSHLDHDLSEPQINYLLAHFADRDTFFIETITLPTDLGTVPCALYGPVMGDLPVSEPEVTYAKRGTREWPSRLIDRPARPQRAVTVIAGPHDGHPCVLYTAFGGPAAPQEPGDVRRQLEAVERERRERDRTTGDPSGAADPAERAKADPIYARIVELRTKRAESDAFWKDHALAR